MRDRSARSRTASAKANTTNVSAMLMITPPIGNRLATSVARKGIVAKKTRRRAKSRARIPAHSTTRRRGAGACSRRLAGHGGLLHGALLGLGLLHALLEHVGAQ